MPAQQVQLTEVKPNTFRRQLGFWSIHCTLTALPSFLIAIQYFKGAAAILAMLAGVLTFVFGYALLTSTGLYGKFHHGLVGRSVKLGATIRMAISLCSLPLVLSAIASGEDFSNGSFSGGAEMVVWVPDFWFGYIAIIVVAIGFNAMGLRSPTNSLNDPDRDADFFFTYVTTLTEGVLISLSLLMLSFLILIILSFRKNSRQLPSEHFQQWPPQPPHDPR